MRSLSFYILRQVIGPFALFSLLLTLVVWMTQSLRLLDLVINRGQSAAIFAYLTLLMVPSLLVIIMPIAFFAAVLYSLSKLSNDSELVVMWSAGISRLQLAIPVLTGAIIVMALTYLCSLYLMPLGQRMMKDKVFDIRADIGAAILKEGAFTTPTEGLTVFIRELSPGGEIRGILVHDNRDVKKPVTYLAESGVLAQTEAGARLIMRNGNVEQGGGGGSRPAMLRFDRYVFDLDQYASAQRVPERETGERYISELLNPDLAGEGQSIRRNIYFAEAHNRLSSPLYCLAFALIALAAVARSHTGRSGHAMRLSMAAFLGASLRLVGYGAQGAAASNPVLGILLYLLPLLGAGFAAADLSDIAWLRRRPGREPTEIPA